ncbi:ankyrin repeat-containing domain protein [Nemania abortiva]|nr:ankyrin repeat-containing domain protein [Nemania abortiva]
MVQLLDLPPELAIAIFEAVALTRSFKRLMRLRLVSRQFKFFVEHVIFSQPLPQHIADAVKREFSHRRDPHPFYLEYLVRQAVVATELRSRFGRIRRAAVELCEMAGDTGHDALVETLRCLCRLSFRPDHPFRYSHKPRSRCPSSWPVEPSSNELDTDLCVAAIYLGRHAHVEQLTAQGWTFCAWDDDPRSDIFGSAFNAACLRGDISMIRLLLSSNPNYNPSEALPSLIWKGILEHATSAGHKDAFDFAIDSGPLGVNEVSKYTPHDTLTPEYASVRRAVESTSVVENYRRGVAMLLPHNNRGPKNFNDDLEWAMGNSAFEGHIDMVRYFLDSDASQNSNKAPLNKSLRRAVQGGKIDVVRLLLQHGANPNRSSRLRTPLMFAAWTSSISIARLLLESGAKPKVGRPPPIVLAVAKEDAAMFRLLCEHGARLDTPEAGGWAMAVAQFWGLESMIDMLVEEGVERDVVLHRCPERRELAEISWYLFL